MIDVFERYSIECDDSLIRVVKSLHQICDCCLDTKRRSILNLIIIDQKSRLIDGFHTLPPPEGPTRATFAPGFNVRFTPCIQNIIIELALLQQSSEESPRLITEVVTRTSCNWNTYLQNKFFGTWRISEPHILQLHLPSFILSGKSSPPEVKFLNTKFCCHRSTKCQSLTK